MSGAPSAGSVRDFVALRRLALAGASRSGKKFGNVIFRELVARGYDVVPIHPEAPEIEGVPCERDVAAVAGKVEGLVVVTPPETAARLVGEAAATGIRQVWLQQGAGSEEAARRAAEAGVSLVQGHCLLMFLPEVRGLHRFHRFLWRILGKLPAEAARA